MEQKQQWHVVHLLKKHEGLSYFLISKLVIIMEQQQQRHLLPQVVITGC